MTPTLDILERLISFDTVSSKSNLPLIDYVQDFLTTRGFTVHRVMDETGQKAGLFAVIGPPGKGILLSAHTDVVPVQGQNWTCDPFRLTRKDDRLYGRGTTDMKGYLAAMLACADQASKMELKEPLKLSISYDEEIGCVGIKSMITHLEPTIGTARACFVGEPTEMKVAIGHKGKASLRATCHGQEGHSALAPLFVNALHLASDFVIGLKTLQAHYESDGENDQAYEIPYSTVHVGKITGGVALNIVPKTALVDFEFRHLASETSSQLLSKAADLANEISSQYTPTFLKARIELDQWNGYPGLETQPDQEIVSFAQSLTKTDGTTKVSFGTEAGYFSDLGIPTIVCGPGSMRGQGHQPDEYVEFDQLAKCDQMMGRLLKNLHH